MATQMEPSPKARFKESVKTFFELENMDKEWDMFATRNMLDNERHSQSTIAALRDRLCLQFRRGRNVTLDCWFSRFEEWDKHLDGYLAIDSATVATRVTAGPSHGTKRVDKLTSHLSTLDTKLSMAIGLNSLLLAGSTFLVKETDDLVAFAAFPGTASGWMTAKVLQGLLYFFLALAMGCCLSNIWHGLRAFRRVVWGDLHLYPGNPTEGERRQTDFLIISLTRRTNLFRVITYVTTLACQFIFCYTAFALLILVLKVWFVVEARIVSH